jgi:hypothetical protein
LKNAFLWVVGHDARIARYKAALQFGSSPKGSARSPQSAASPLSALTLPADKKYQELRVLARTVRRRRTKKLKSAHVRIVYSTVVATH